jgi:lipopolysaccharide/colanic/teichoic acid biosynthesis glycosyltransferase
MQRVLDVILSPLILILLAPVLLVVVLVLTLTLPGNPFYRGDRTGRNGKRFRIWKLRTMIPNAARIGPPITGRDDPRVTRFGRFLRRTKLDEIPQLLNVLSGEMTLVGPRPESPEITKFYNSRQREVLSVKPGVTGPVQLCWAGESDCIPPGDAGRQFYIEHLMDPKIQADLKYLRARTTFSDFRILWLTAALVSGRLLGIHGGESVARDLSARSE